MPRTLTSWHRALPAELREEGSGLDLRCEHRFELDAPEGPERLGRLCGIVFRCSATLVRHGGANTLLLYPGGVSLSASRGAWGPVGSEAMPRARRESMRTTMFNLGLMTFRNALAERPRYPTSKTRRTPLARGDASWVTSAEPIESAGSPATVENAGHVACT